MLKNIVRDILIVAGIIVMAVSTSDHCMNWLYEKRTENEAWWGVHKDVEGDLVAISYMQRVEKFSSQRDYAFTRPSYPGKNVDLYAWGDSYIWKIPDSAYAGIRNYKFGWRYRDDVNYKLDTSQVSILVIEISERYVRSYFAGTDIFNHLKKDQSTTLLYTPTRPNYAAIELPGMEKLFNTNINQNIEFNLFNYNFINPIRQWKAAMNYHLFNRASGSVVISKDEKQLFLRETLIGNKPENSYNPVRKTELDSLVDNINTIYNHYKEDGFNEVYFSFIPNPVTILQPERYNKLIPLIESHPQLQAEFISVYDLYQATNKRIYRPGDTHWNNEGLQIWLSEINKMLIRHNELAN